MDTIIRLKTEYILLAATLKFASVVSSGGEAKVLIQEGLVHLNGKPDTRRGAKVRAGDTVFVNVKPPIRIRVVAK